MGGYQALEVVDGGLSVLTDGIIKGVVTTGITMAGVGIILHEELDGLQVALGGRDAKGGTAIIVEGIDSPALVLEDGHVPDIISESCIEETVVIVIQILNLDRGIGMLLAELGTLRLKEGGNLFVVGIIERSGVPSVLRVNVCTLIEKVFHCLYLASSHGNVQRGTVVVVALIQRDDTSLGEEVENSDVTA